MRPAKESSYLHTFYSRWLRLSFVTLAMLASFGCGIFYSKTIPRTIFYHPLTTLRLMKVFPLGTNVVPINTPEAKAQFEQFGWATEPAIVVDYETVTLQGKEILLCHVRTHRGTGYILSVNPDWIRSQQRPSMLEVPKSSKDVRAARPALASR